MGKDNLMGLFETQEYISSEKHEWNVPVEMKDKVAQMVQKYNKRAIKKGYENSMLAFDEESLILSGIFVLKHEKKSFFGQMCESGTNGDLTGDIRSILRLCTKECPNCVASIPALSKSCKYCMTQLFNTEKESEKATEEESLLTKSEEISEEQPKSTEEHISGIKYELFDITTPFESEQDVPYYQVILNGLDEFIDFQKKNPENEVLLDLALDFDKLNPDEELDENDPLVAIYSFSIKNIVFNTYNKCKPLFEGKANCGMPQIFVVLNNADVKIEKVQEIAAKHGISYVIETNYCKNGNVLREITFSFDDDCVSAASFICLVADSLLSVPKDVPVVACVCSSKSKKKAQKEFKKHHTYGVTDFVKEVVGFVRYSTSSKK